MKFNRNEFEIKKDLRECFEMSENEFTAERESELEDIILSPIEDAYDLIEEYNLKKPQDIFKTDTHWGGVFTFVMRGLAMARYYSETDTLTPCSCKNDEFVNEEGIAQEEFGMGNCSYLDCPNRVSYADGFSCRKHNLWLPPTTPDGERFIKVGEIFPNLCP